MVVAVASAHRRRVGEQRETPPSTRPWELMEVRGGHLDGQTRLADATDAGDGHEAVGAQELDDLGKDPLAPDEAGGRHSVGCRRGRDGRGGRETAPACPRRTAGTGARPAEGRGVCGRRGRARSALLRAGRRSAHRRAPVRRRARRHDAGRPARHGAQVAAVALDGPGPLSIPMPPEPKVAQPGLLGQGTLRRGRGVADRVGGCRRAAPKPSPSEAKMRPPCSQEGCAQELVVAVEGPLHQRCVVLHQQRRTFDVGEEERRPVG